MEEKPEDDVVLHEDNEWGMFSHLLRATVWLIHGIGITLGDEDEEDNSTPTTAQAASEKQDSEVSDAGLQVRNFFPV